MNHTTNFREYKTTFCGLPLSENRPVDWVDADCMICLENIITYVDNDKNSVVLDEYNQTSLRNAIDVVRDNYKKLKYQKDFGDIVNE